MSKFKVGTTELQHPPLMTIARSMTERGWEETWNLTGVLIGDGPTAIAALENTLRATIAGGDDEDWKLTDDSDRTLEILEASAADLVEVSALNFPKGDGGQFATNRVWTVTVRALFRHQTSDVVVWTEACHVEEGGAKILWDEVQNEATPPISYKGPVSPSAIVQSGSAVGLTGYPDFPSCKYSQSALQYPVVKDFKAPKRRANGELTEYGISWSYRFEFASLPSLVMPTTPPS